MTGGTRRVAVQVGHWSRNRRGVSGPEGAYLSRSTICGQPRIRGRGRGRDQLGPAGAKVPSLHVVHTWVWPLMKVRFGPAPGAPAGAGLQAQPGRTLAKAAETA